jgi:hypothetical protein
MLAASAGNRISRAVHEKEPSPGKTPQINAANANRLNNLAKDGSIFILTYFRWTVKAFPKQKAVSFSRWERNRTKLLFALRL